jgi:hypothetical protein
VFFLFGFPFGFFLPLLFLIIGIRALSRIIHELTRDSTQYHHRGVPTRRDRYGYESSIFDFVDRRGRSLEAQIFKLAYKMKGRLTLSDIVVETGLDLEQAEKVIESMVDGMRVRMEVDERGVVVYEFPEIIMRFENE